VKFITETQFTITAGNEYLKLDFSDVAKVVTHVKDFTFEKDQ